MAAAGGQMRCLPKADEHRKAGRRLPSRWLRSRVEKDDQVKAQHGVRMRALRAPPATTPATTRPRRRLSPRKARQGQRPAPTPQINTPPRPTTATNVPATGDTPAHAHPPSEGHLSRPPTATTQNPVKQRPQPRAQAKRTRQTKSDPNVEDAHPPQSAAHNKADNRSPTSQVR